MPILDVHSWSQFTRANAPEPTEDVPDLSGTAVFGGGPPLTLLLNTDGATGLALDQAIAIDGARFRAGSPLRSVGRAGAAAAIVALDGVPVGLAAGRDGLSAGDELPLVPHDPAAPGAPPETEPFRGVVCFAAGTQLATPDGPRRVETLRPGMDVTTADSGPQPVIWTGRREVLFNRHDNRYRPILFKAGSLGPNRPVRDLIVSPDHRMVLSGRAVGERCGSADVLVPASALIGLRGVRPMLGKRRVTYVHVMLGAHTLLDAEGAGAESFLPDATALAALADAQRASLFATRPDLRDTPAGDCPPPVRPVLDADAGARLAQHLKSGGWPATGKRAAVAAG